MTDIMALRRRRRALFIGLNFIYEDCVALGI